MVHPAVEETLGVVIFYGGFNAVIPGEMYSTVLKKTASHGLIILAVWPVFGSLNVTRDTYKLIEWVSHYISWTTGLLPTFHVWNT